MTVPTVMIEREVTRTIYLDAEKVILRVRLEGGALGADHVLWVDLGPTAAFDQEEARVIGQAFLDAAEDMEKLDASS